MTPEDAVNAVAAWAQDVLGDDLKWAYPYVPAGKSESLPDLVVEVTRSVITLDGEALFREWRLQQRMVEIHEVMLAFMVGNDDPMAAAVVLRSFGERLQAAWLRSATLGGRVPMRSPFCEFDYTTPFVEYEDGTKGREMTMSVAVGDLVEAD